MAIENGSGNKQKEGENNLATTVNDTNSIDYGKGWGKGRGTGAPTDSPQGTGQTTRILVFAYGVIAHLGFLAVFLYLVGFLGDFGVPKRVDSAPTRPLWEALLIDGLLLGLFAVQHSVMARKGFKDWWTRFVPKPIERSTYVMISNVLMAAVFWFWSPSAARFGASMTKQRVGYSTPSSGWGGFWW